MLVTVEENDILSAKIELLFLPSIFNCQEVGIQASANPSGNVALCPKTCSLRTSPSSEALPSAIPDPGRHKKCTTPSQAAGKCEPLCKLKSLPITNAASRVWAACRIKCNFQCTSERVFTSLSVHGDGPTEDAAAKAWLKASQPAVKRSQTLSKFNVHVRRQHIRHTCQFSTSNTYSSVFCWYPMNARNCSSSASDSSVSKILLHL